MSDIKDGGPAFPVECDWVDGQPRGKQTGNARGFYEGMTLRDYFAIRAPSVPDDFAWGSGEVDSWERQPRWAFVYADAMLKARGEQ